MAQNVLSSDPGAGQKIVLSSDPNAGTPVRDRSAYPSPPLDARGSLKRFVTAAGDAINPLHVLRFGKDLFTDPVGTVSGIGEQFFEQTGQAETAAREGRVLPAAGHLLAATPIIGPAVKAGVDRVREGDVAGGLGELTGTAALFGGPGAVRGAGRLGARTRAGASVARAADESATSRFVDIAAPKVGPNKLRFGRDAQRVAPEILRDDALGGFSREALHRGVEVRLAEAEALLDAAADARLNARVFDTAPILRQLRTQRQELVSETAEASRSVRRTTTRESPILGPEGRPLTATDVTAEPFGRDVVPGPNRGQVAIIDQAIAEIEALGPQARYESLRRIRAAYDGPAKATYHPSLTSDFLSKQGEKIASAHVTRVLRKHLSSFDPKTADANASYTLYRAAQDVLEATAETERVRPRVGRRIVAKAAGSAVGGASHGLPGAAAGAILMGVVERAASAAPTLQLTIARRLAGVSDALRTGNVARAESILQRIVRLFPPVRTGLSLSVTAGRQPTTETSATGQTAGPPSTPEIP